MLEMMRLGGRRHLVPSLLFITLLDMWEASSHIVRTLKQPKFWGTEWSLLPTASTELRLLVDNHVSEADPPVLVKLSDDCSFSYHLSWNFISCTYQLSCYWIHDPRKLRNNINRCLLLQAVCLIDVCCFKFWSNLLRSN